MPRLSVMLVFTYVLLGIPSSATTVAAQSSVGSVNWQIFFPYPRRVATLVAELDTGKVLVASRQLRDPNFAETVILLLEYSEKGAMGVVLTRPTTVSLATVFAKVQALKKRQDVVYLGGPVERDHIVLLARATREPEDAKQILRDVYLVHSQASLQQLVAQGDENLRLRAYAGYAGWAPEQLDAEIARGDWHVQPTDAAIVFDTPADQLWPELIRRSEFEWARSLHWRLGTDSPRMSIVNSSTNGPQHGS